MMPRPSLLQCKSITSEKFIDIENRIKWREKEKKELRQQVRRANDGALLSDMNTLNGSEKFK